MNTTEKMVKSIKKIIIDPKCKINYASYYIYGLWSFLGKRKIHFDIGPFITLPCNNRKEYDRGLALLLVYNDNSRKNIFIDYYDASDIDEPVYDWCDLYCKINIPLASVSPKFQDKLFPIGPSFSISIWSWTDLVLNCFRNYQKSKNYYKLDLKRWVSDYMFTNIRRLKINKYNHTRSNQDYCFHVSTLWYDLITDNTTNRYRGSFLRACQKLYCNLEGGFFYITSKSVIDEYPPYIKYKEEFKDLLIIKRISAKSYLEKTKKSAIVFNTPSVGGCHGWKLAEYLSMGKAIISTPLTNVMPGDFIPGIHYHLVENESEIESAVAFLHGNNEYRLKLENGASIYYNKYLTPEKVIQRILNKLIEMQSLDLF